MCVCGKGVADVTIQHNDDTQHKANQQAYANQAIHPHRTGILSKKILFRRRLAIGVVAHSACVVVHSVRVEVHLLCVVAHSVWV